MRSHALTALLVLATSVVVPGSAAARDVPPLGGPVVDEAGLLDVGARRRLEGLSRAAWEGNAQHRVQLQYLVVKSLGGEDIEGFAVRVFEAWKLGERGKDNGVLVVVARDDRKIRIETGYGNEGGLTDAQAGRIIRSTIAPAFREGRYGEGLFAAGVQVLSALGALPENTARKISRPDPLHGIGAALLVLVGILFVVARLFSGLGPRRRRFWYGGMGSGLGGGWGGGGLGGGLGGGGGWGGGGGGSWGGGGGSSGGGGASGNW